MPASLSAYLIPNLYEADSYYAVDTKTGVMRDRNQTKVVTLSGMMLKGLYIGLKNETGPAWALVLRRCGETWGTRFAKRFLGDISAFYGQPLDQMPMARFTALMVEYFAVSGWGKLNFDFRHIGGGLIIAEVNNALLGDVLRSSGERADVLLEGVLKALFCAVTGKEMDCYETQCIAQGAPSCLFIIGLESRLADVPEMLEKNEKHAEILAKLLKKS